MLSCGVQSAGHSWTSGVHPQIFQRGKAQMNFGKLREEVLDANLELVRQGLVLYTFGNVSGISRAEGVVIIKPSGVPYDRLKPADLVATDLAGNTLEGRSSGKKFHVAVFVPS